MIKRAGEGGIRHCAEGVSELLPERSRAAIKRRRAFGQ